MELLFGFALLCTLIELTPGPNMSSLMVLSMVAGRRAGFAMVIGIALGLALMGTAAALGVAQMVTASSALYDVLRWLGVAYLLWIAWQTWHAETTVASGSSTSLASYDLRYLRHGLLINLFNPKAVIFYVSILPRFIDPAGHVFTQTLLLTGISVTIATLVHIGIVLFASRLTPLFHNPHRERQIRRTFAWILAAIALWMMV